MTLPESSKPRGAPPELLVLSKWEESMIWLFDHTAKWPKSHRFTFAQRVQNLALEILDNLVLARYTPRERQRVLLLVNAALERMRHLLRIAERLHVMPKKGFETAMRAIDETGRMAYGWRTNQGQGAAEGKGGGAGFRGEADASSNRVNRGGSFRNDARNLRGSNRNRNSPSNRNDNLGFRPALQSGTTPDRSGLRQAAVPVLNRPPSCACERMTPAGQTAPRTRGLPLAEGPGFSLLDSL